MLVLMCQELISIEHEDRKQNRKNRNEMSMTHDTSHGN
jgi:hypothetical protein